MTTTLDDLIARLEKAEGPDRELDGDIAEFLGLPPKGWSRSAEPPDAEPPDAEPVWLEDPAWWARIWTPPRLTASGDAALTLMLEGWRFDLYWDPMDGGHAVLCRTPDDGVTIPIEARAPTPALALMTAILKARKMEDKAP